MGRGEARTQSEFPACGKWSFVFGASTICTAGAKDPLFCRRGFVQSFSLKKGAGRTFHSPRCSSRFADPALRFPFGRASSGQNLAALCTAAGQNLAAVGSRHSLAETVNLGTVTAAGLIGTLHSGYTSCQSTYAQQSFFDRSNAK